MEILLKDLQDPLDESLTNKKRNIKVMYHYRHMLSPNFFRGVGIGPK